MKKIRKIMIILISIITLALVSIITYNVIATENLSIIDVKFSSDKWHSSILYSNNKLLMWNDEGEEKIVENVKKREHINSMPFEPDYLTYNNELYYNSNTDGKIKKIENVVDFKTGLIDYDKTIVYKDTNNTLFYIKYNEYSEWQIKLDDYNTLNFLEMLDVYSIEHNITDYEENDNQVPVYLIYSPTCFNCYQFMNYLSKLDSETYNKIKIIGISVDDYYNYQLVNLIENQYNLSINSTPTIIIGETSLIGNSPENQEELIKQLNEMYSKSAEERYDFIKEYNKSLNVEPIELARNVDQFVINTFDYKGYIMYTTFDKKSYVFGDNLINYNYDYSFTTPFLLMENVKKIDNYYLITENNELYIFPTSYNNNLSPIDSDVSDVIKFIHGYTSRIIAKTPDGRQKIIYFQNSTKDSYVSYYGPTIKDISLYTNIYYDTKFILTEDNKLYTENIYFSDNFEEIKSDVKEIIRSNDFSYDEILILYNNGELHYLCLDSYCRGDDFVNEMTGITQFERNEEHLLLENVDTIKYYNERFILMKDKAVYRYGNNSSNEFKNMDDISYSDIPVQIDELINNGKEILPSKLILELDKTKTQVDSVIHYEMKTMPANVPNKNKIQIEDESIIKHENGHLRTTKEGKTNVCLIYNNDNNFKSCKNIEVYPQITSISIVEDEITMYNNEPKVINIDYLPTNALDDSLNYIWYVNGEQYNDYIDVEFEEYYDPEIDEYITLNSNQIAIEGYQGGTYTLELFQAGCETDKCRDTVKINVIEKASYIDLKIDEEYYDGINNVYMFINEKDTLQVEYEMLSETTANKNVIYSSGDPSIASIDQNGLITAHKPGKTTIVLSSEDGGTSRDFNLTVYDYTKQGAMKGDVNKDGEVNILDVIKLRKYLAGLEELEIE